MNKSEQARAVMLEHHLNCAQSVVSTYCEEFGLDRNLGLKVAMGFGGGMARTGKNLRRRDRGVHDPGFIAAD